MTPTINEAIALQTQLKVRLNELTRLRNESAVTEVRWMGDTSNITKTPMYDLKKLDQKITQLQNWLFKLDYSIKSKNAQTKIDLGVPVEELLSPLD